MLIMNADAVVSAAVVVPSAAELRAALPPLEGSVTVVGLRGDVQVWRDEWGIPHILAGNEPDAWFAQGFATAQDRLWAMEYDRRRAVGRWAEVVGASAVGQDRQMRRLRLEDAARADYDAAGIRARGILDAYTAGVNAFIGSEAPLPAEYAIVGVAPEPWQAWHSLAIYKVRHIFMGVFEGKAWRARLVAALGAERAAALFPSYPPGQPVIVPTGASYDGIAGYGLEQMLAQAAELNHIGETDGGSNSWVIAGEHTATGGPILAGDSHRGLDTPGVYYQNHLACDRFDVIGVSFAGVPGFPHFGHNRRVAWSVTHTNGDYQDLYLEEFNDADPALYRAGGDWRLAEVRDEVIKARGGEDTVIRTWATHHGPVVAGDPVGGRGIALRYTAADGGDPWADILPAMLEAGSVSELADAMAGWVDPVNNLLMADIHGNIGYQCRGEIPRRPGDAPAPLPVPGWDGRHEWQGSIPFAELPRSINPPQGYIVTANNRPVGSDYPYYIGMDFAPGYRAMRIADALGRLRRPAASDMGRIHAERVSLSAQTYAAALGRLSESGLLASANPLAAAAWERLREWDGAMDGGAPEPTIYSALRDALLWRLLAHNLGEELAALTWQPVDRGRGMFLNRFRNLVADAIAADDTTLLPDGSDWPGALASALEEAVGTLAARLGPEVQEWRWERVHRARPRHPLSLAMPALAAALDPPEIAYGGDGDTPWAGAYAPADLATVGSLSVFRYAYDPFDWERSLWAVPLGSSGHPGSRHYADQSAMWAEARMAPMRYGWAGIAAAAETAQDAAGRVA